MTIDSFLRYLILIGLLISLGVWIWFGYINKNKKLYSWSPILFAVHALIFSAISALNLLSKNAYLIWGDLVSIHGVVILISTGVVLIQLSEGGKK